MVDLNPALTPEVVGEQIELVARILESSEPDLQALVVQVG